jgi:hypothetical protein
MDTLPTELHSVILSLACDQDRNLAPRLLLTSKYTHSVALPFRFYHVNISSSSDITGILLALEHAPPHLRSIRHFTFDDGPVSPHMRRRPTLCNTHSLRRLLNHASPTLQTLHFSLQQVKTVDQLLIFPDTLPRLLEFTLLCRRINGRSVSLPLMPQLHSLHVIGDSILIEELPPLAPNLRSLHLHRYPIPRWFLGCLESVHGAEAVLPRESHTTGADHITGGYLPNSSPSDEDMTRVDRLITRLDRFTVEFGQPWCMEARYARIDTERRGFLEATREALKLLAGRLPFLVLNDYVGTEEPDARSVSAEHSL